MVINCMSNGKDMIIHLKVGLIKKTFYEMSQYFPKPFKSFGENVSAKVDLSNLTAKTDLKNITHTDSSNFALKTNLAGLKAKLINYTN